MERISPAVVSLAERIASGVQAKGYELAEVRTPETGAGIVSFRRAGTEPRAIVRKLQAEGVMAAPRGGWVRTSPHFYVSPSEIDRMLELLP